MFENITKKGILVPLCIIASVIFFIFGPDLNVGYHGKKGITASEIDAYIWSLRFKPGDVDVASSIDYDGEFVQIPLDADNAKDRYFWRVQGDACYVKVRIRKETEEEFDIYFALHDHGGSVQGAYDLHDFFAYLYFDRVHMSYGCDPDSSLDFLNPLEVTVKGSPLSVDAYNQDLKWQYYARIEEFEPDGVIMKRVYSYDDLEHFAPVAESDIAQPWIIRGLGCNFVFSVFKGHLEFRIKFWAPRGMYDFWPAYAQRHFDRTSHPLVSCTDGNSFAVLDKSKGGGNMNVP